MSRGERIHNEERKKTKCRKILQNKLFARVGESKYIPTDKEVGRMAHTPQLCSCDGCCNRRRAKWSKGKAKLTMQERKQEEACQDS